MYDLGRIYNRRIRTHPPSAFFFELSLHVMTEVVAFTIPLAI